MKLFYTPVIVLFLLLISTPILGQGSAANQIKAYIGRANAALSNENWDTALNSIEEAQKLAGRNGAVFESVRVRAYYGKGEYARAKQSMTTFYSLNPSQQAVNEIAAYETMIDDKLQEEKDRIARLQEQEEERRAREERRQQEYEEMLASLNVGEEAYQLAKSVQRDVSGALGSRGKTDYLPTTARGTWGRKGRWNVQGGYNSPDVTTDFTYRISYGFGKRDGLEISIPTSVSVAFENTDEGRSFGSDCKGGDVTFVSAMSYDFRTTGSNEIMKSRYLSLSFESPSSYMRDDLPVIFGCNVSSYYGNYGKTIERANNKLRDGAERYAKSVLDVIDKRFAFTDEQSVAFEQNEEEFKWYFNQVLLNPSKSYETLKGEKEWEEEQERQRAERAKIRKAKYDGIIVEGDAALQNNDLQSAKGFYQKAAELYPYLDYPKDQIKKIDDKVAGLAAAKSSSYQNLRNIFSQLNEGRSDNQAALKNGIESFESHLKSYPDDAEALNLYAYLLANAETNLEKALTMALRANELKPGQASILDTVGWVYFKKLDLINAREYLLKANQKYDFNSEASIWHLLTVYNSELAFDSGLFVDDLVKFARIAQQKSFSASLVEEVLEKNCPGNLNCNYTFTSKLVAAYQGKWLVSYEMNDESQKVLREADFKLFLDKIDKELKEDFYVTDLEKGDRYWHAVLSRGTPKRYEIIEGEDVQEFGDEISKYWDKNYDITDVEFFNGKWYGVMVKGIDSPSMGYSSRGDYNGITEVIKSRFEEGYGLYNLEYGGGVYFGLFSKAVNSGLTWNVFDVEADFNDFLHSVGGDGYDVFSLSPVEPSGVFVISEKQTRSMGYEVYDSLDDFYQTVKKDWFDKGYVIRNMEYQKKVN